MHNYAQANKKLPPAYIADKNGKPLLSWRVLLLPYLEGDALHQQFHLDEPWDSEHNKKLITKMPAAYRSPASTVSGQGKTNYLTVRGKDTVFSGEDGATYASITDGASTTIHHGRGFRCEGCDMDKPDDFEYDAENPLKDSSAYRPVALSAGFADGSVRFIPSSISPTTVKAMFTRPAASSLIST